MFTGIDINATRKYISPNDPDKNNPTVFHIAQLDPRLQAHIEDKCTTMHASASGKKDEPAEVGFAMKKRACEFVRFGVRGIDGLLDPATNFPIEIKLDNVSIGQKAYQALPEKIIGMLGMRLIEELAAEVERGQVLTGEEAKN